MFQESDDTNEFSQELLSEMFSDSDSPSDQGHSTETGDQSVTGSQSQCRGVEEVVQPLGQKQVFKSGRKYILGRCSKMISWQYHSNVFFKR